MKTAIATVSISGTLTEKLDAIAEAGFDGIEIFEQDFVTDTGSARDVGNRIRDKGLEVSLFQPFRDFEGLPEPYRTKAFDRAERKFDLMQDLGTDLILVCSSLHPRALGGIDRAADDLRALGERAAARGLRARGSAQEFNEEPHSPNRFDSVRDRRFDNARFALRRDDYFGSEPSFVGHKVAQSALFDVNQSPDALFRRMVAHQGSGRRRFSKCGGSFVGSNTGGQGGRHDLANRSRWNWTPSCRLSAIRAAFA